MKDKNKKEIMKIIIISVLLFICLLLTIYFHAILNFESVYTHFFYIPIILSALWWKKRGMIVSVLLSLSLIISHFLLNGNLGVYNDFFRIVFFTVISYTVALLSERIKKAEEFFREMFNHMSSGVVVYDAIDEADDFIITDFNKASESINIVNKNGVIGKRVTEIFPGVKDLGLFDVFKRVWQTGKPEKFPVTHYKDNRIDGWRENYVYKLSSGEIVAMYDDVTGHKQAEDELYQQREEHQIILDSVPAMIFYKNKEDKFIRVNETLAKTFCMSKEEIIGKTASELSPTQEKDYWEDDKQVISSGQPKRNIIEPVETPEGTKWYQTDKIPFKDDNGNIIGIIGFSIDITDRKQAEDALRESEEKHRLLAENTVDCIWQTNMNLEFTYINQAVFPYLGFTPEEWIGSKLTDHCSQEEAEKTHVIISDALANLPDNTGTTFEMKFYHKNGAEIPGEVKGKVLLDDAGNPIGLQGITRDISEHKKAEEERKKT